MKPIRRVAVLGAGTMGSRIAAQLANARIPSVLLDLDVSATRGGLDAALKGRPGAFFVPESATLITTGSFDADLAKISDCDWIVEAVSENLAIKRALYDRVIVNRTPGTIVSTNTSGIPLSQIAEGYSDEFREHFLGTHFFNPPRYLHLAELIPGPATRPEVMEFIAEFCDLHLGKGVVPCKDTPNFIANRIGSFLGSTIQKLTVEQDLTIEEVDLLTGQLIGLPKSASFRLLDIVGLDVWAHVTKNLYEAVPGDLFRERFIMQPFLMEMIARGWLGDKRGQGCYKRVGKEREIHAIDWKTLEYHPAAKPRFDSLESVRKIEPLSDRLRALVALDDKAGRFLWQALSDHIIYAAHMVPEISDRIVEIDRAMRWGYANALGPFELWDALGFEPTARRAEAEGRTLPGNVQRMLSEGAQSFYRAADAERLPRTEYFDLAAGTGYKLAEPRPGVVVLAELKRARGVVKKNPGASLIDMGDGVLCCEFHSKMNSLGEDVFQMLQAGLAQLEINFDAMVIGNQGENFSVGANLMMVLLAAQEEEWDDLNAAINRYQQINLALKYAAKPVVAAPYGMALGGGCETPMHCARIQASAELYMGLVEVGVGLIPAGGGCKEMLLRSKDVKKIFEQIGFAKISTSAVEARHFRYLRDSDGISMNPERLLDDAKQLALSLMPGYAPGAPRTDITVPGEAGFALMKMGVWMARQGGYISDYDAVIGEKLAYVLSGGRLTGTPQVSEQYLLDLEREAFLSLCGRKETQARMQHMLKTGEGAAELSFVNDLKALGAFHFGDLDKSCPLGSLKQALATTADLTDNLVVLPEGFNVPGGFYSGNDPDTSVRSDLLKLSETHGIAFVAGLIDNDPRYNSAYLIDAACKESIRLLSRKRQQAGQHYISDPRYESEPVVHRGFGIATLICYDFTDCDEHTRAALINHTAWTECEKRILCVPSYSTHRGCLESAVENWVQSACIAAANGSAQDNSFVQGLGFDAMKLSHSLLNSATSATKTTGFCFLSQAAKRAGPRKHLGPLLLRSAVS